MKNEASSAAASIDRIIANAPEDEHAAVTDVTDVQPSNSAAANVTADTPKGVTAVTSDEPATDKISVTAQERPCYRVLDDWTHVDQASRKLKPGVYCFGYTPATEKKSENFSHIWICSPLYIDAITYDEQDHNYGRLLRFLNTRNTWRTWAMPMELLRGGCDELRGELLAMGVEISPDDRPALARYIQEIRPGKEVRCALQVGWCDGNFVLPDHVIGSSAKAVTYQTGQRNSNEYTTAGSLHEWRDTVAKLAIGNPMLMLGLSVAFAGPLLKRCNAESGGVHLVGDSSTGKTTILHAACSVWGGENYRRSWRATANGLEGAAQLFNDNLLALDEISECDPSEVGNVVYQLANGRGKQRAGRKGNALQVAQWRCVVLSNGERSIDTTMREAGRSAKTGQLLRILNVPVSREHGAWDDLHGFESGSAMSDAIKKSAAKNHGHAGREYLRKLTLDGRNFSTLFDDYRSCPKFSIEGMDGQIKRAANRFALFGFAGELATEYGLTGWPEGAATEAVALAFRLWLNDQGDGDNETRQICDQVREFIEQHGDSRFSRVGHTEISVRDRAGWWEYGGEDRQYLFTSGGMREALHGQDFKRSLNVLQSVGALNGPETGERAKSRRIDGTTVKVYSISPSALEVRS